MIVRGHQLVCNSRKQATFTQTKEASSNQQTRVALNDSHQGAANAPRNHHRGDPDPRPEPLHGHVGRDLSHDVEREEDGQGIVIHEARHAKVGLERVESGVANVGAVEKGQEIEQSHKRDDDPVNLADQLLCVCLAPARILNGAGLVGKVHVVGAFSNMDACCGAAWRFVFHGEVRVKGLM